MLDGSGLLIVEDVGVDEDSGTAYFNVIFNGSFPGGFSVSYSTENETAWAGTDYVAKSGTLDFEGATDGETQTVYVDILDSGLVEFTEQFLFNLGTVTPFGPGTVAILDGTAFCEITDNDQAVISLTAVPASAAEGNAGSTHTVTFIVSMDHPVHTDVTVHFETSETGGALASDGDFVAQSGTLHLSGGTPSQVTVTVNGDAKTELDELLFFRLDTLQANGLPVSFESGEDYELAWHTITNDDHSTININVASVTVDEAAGTATITAQLVGEVDHAVVVLMTTDAGTASGGAGDYNATATNLTFSGADQETKTYTVTINDDNIVEAAVESFDVTLAIVNTGGRDVRLGRSLATVNIEDNDESQISINDVSANEGTSPTGWTEFVFTLTLTKPIDTAITIDYYTVAVTATGTGNLDYIHVDPPITITIPAMTTSVSITIYVRPDSVDEANETFKVILNNLVAPGRNVIIADPPDENDPDGEGIGTIVDDDP